MKKEKEQSNDETIEETNVLLLNITNIHSNSTLIHKLTEKLAPYIFTRAVS